MAIRSKMVVKTTKKKMDGGDKNEPGKKPKTTTLKMSESSASVSAGKYKPTKSVSIKSAASVKGNIGKINPVTGKIMTKAEADAMARQLEKKKRS